jgi:hypothetical protein
LGTALYKENEKSEIPCSKAIFEAGGRISISR